MVEVHLPGSAPGSVPVKSLGCACACFSCRLQRERARDEMHATFREWDRLAHRKPRTELRFALGRQFLKGHVVREVNPAVPSTPETATYLDKFWKPIHMRVGYFPRRDDVPKAELANWDWSDPLVYWSGASRSATDALSKVSGVRAPGARKTSEAPAGARLRQRARWVLGLNPDKQRRWVGALFSGRWTPDLTAEMGRDAQPELVAARGGGVEFLGGGTLEIPASDDQSKSARTLSYVWARHAGTTFRLFPELLARLSCYASLRKRDAVLVTALRSRAQDWCKKIGMDAEIAGSCLAPSVAVAFSQTAQELAAEDILSTAGPGAENPKAVGWWASGI